MTNQPAGPAATVPTTGERGSAVLQLRVGTTEGIATFARHAKQWNLESSLLKDTDVNVLAHQPGQPDVIFAGTYGEGLLRSTDAGLSWTKLDVPDLFIRAIAFSPADPATIYVGTEPANLYRSFNGGDSWEDLDIRRVPGSKNWSLPYSPRAGALRTLVLPATKPGFIYGGVEQGGVIKSFDDGETWSISGKEIHPDVHCLAVDPVNPEKFFAATGGGIFASVDAGESWQGAFEEYTRAVIVHPHASTLVLAGPARDVGEGGSILSSTDGGRTWALAHDGIDFPLPDMVELFAIDPGANTIYAILSDGGLLQSAPDPIRWSKLELEIPCVQTLDFI